MRKTCIVPSCRCSSIFRPNKIFFNVPRNMKLRKAWFDAIGEETIPRGSAYYCCEEHFDIPEDVTNWMCYKFLEGTNLRLKNYVVPHKNLTGRNKNQPKETHILQETAINLPSTNKIPELKTEMRAVAGPSTLEAPQIKNEIHLSPPTSFSQFKSSTSMASASVNEKPIKTKQVLRKRRKDTTKDTNIILYTYPIIFV